MFKQYETDLPGIPSINLALWKNPIDPNAIHVQSLVEKNTQANTIDGLRNSSSAAYTIFFNGHDLLNHPVTMY